MLTLNETRLRDAQRSIYRDGVFMELKGEGHMETERTHRIHPGVAGWKRLGGGVCLCVCLCACGWRRGHSSALKNNMADPTTAESWREHRGPRSPEFSILKMSRESKRAGNRWSKLKPVISQA